MWVQHCNSVVVHRICEIIRKTKNYGNSELPTQYLSLSYLVSWCPTFAPPPPDRYSSKLLSVVLTEPLLRIQVLWHVTPCPSQRFEQ
jgi:hypothetical protein